MHVRIYSMSSRVPVIFPEPRDPMAYLVYKVRRVKQTRLLLGLLNQMSCSSDKVLILYPDSAPKRTMAVSRFARDVSAIRYHPLL